MSTIPADNIVQMNPSVLSAGGTGLDLLGLVLTKNTRVPIGQVLSFPDQKTVANYFGSSSSEASGAGVYFLGFRNKQQTPSALLFSQYPTVGVSAYLRGANLASMSLAQLQALSGVITITINGNATTSGTINLSSATSFSSAASIIQTAFPSPAFTVSYDSISSAFIFLVTVTGPTSTIGYASGTLAAPISLTQATGAVLSQGAAATDPATALNAIVAITTNWATFMTSFNPDASGNANKLLFAKWANAQNKKYMYACFDTDITPTLSVPATTSLGYLLGQAQYDGTALVYEPTDLQLAWFLTSIPASIDFTQKNGNTNAAFRGQDGLTPSVTDAGVAANLLGNGYNFYGAYAARSNAVFNWFYNGQMSGQYKFIRPYINQMWMNANFQLAGMDLFDGVLALPYGPAGQILIEAALADPILAALNFGAIQTGIPLSQLQIAEVNSAAGVDIGSVLQTRGWYLQVLDAAPAVRAEGGSPPVNFWYTDGGSILKLVINSTDVQ